MSSCHEIRRQFIDFFVKKHSHTEVPSSPVVPHADPTLLFANAGMNQFKDVFLGTGSRDFTRAVDTQKCIRAGGKHNDLDDVGKDTYHHTFFEMLGNWSFGDYFKKEAIAWAWELLTEVWQLDPGRLYATYFEGDASEGLEPDSEARDFWLELLPEDRVIPGNKKDNFWEMGDTGPCGPCSELHYDGRPDQQRKQTSGRSLVNADDPNVIEIWNLVFIQFNRGNDGKLTPLPAKHVDTGMGFERIVRVLQGKDSNYDTDVFSPIFKAIQDVTGAAPYGGKLDDSEAGRIDMAYRVIADHIRTLTFALTDGAHCGNEGRNYVLRRILRRAVHFGSNVMGVKENFFYKLVPAVVEAMGETFPELKANPQAVQDELREEEESFRRTLDRGMELFIQESARTFERMSAGWSVGRGGTIAADGKKSDDHNVPDVIGITNEEGNSQRVQMPRTLQEIALVKRKHFSDSEVVLKGEAAFRLYDTYGFPIDLTVVLAEQSGLQVDIDGFNQLMAEARERSRAASGSADVAAILQEIYQKEHPVATEFTGYSQTEQTSQSWVHLFRLREDGYDFVDEAQPGDRVAVQIASTPFYAEGGGQVGDTGSIAISDEGVIRITDTQKIADTWFHIGTVEDGPIRSYKRGPRGSEPEMTCRVDADRRALITANHTATHIMNHKMRQVLGGNVDQRGSLVDEEKTRFDFTHDKPVKAEEVKQIEQKVNEEIAADLKVHWDYAAKDDALSINGLRAVFGEKYPPKVRVVSIGQPVETLLKAPDSEDWPSYSIEFCGGTHLASTSQAERFAILSEENVAKGIRRVTAVTGKLAEQAAQRAKALFEQIQSLDGKPAEQMVEPLAELAGRINEAGLPLVARAELREKLSQLQDVVKQYEKQQSKAAAGEAVEQARTIADEAEGNVIVASLDGADADALRSAMDVIRKKCPEAAMLLASVDEGKVAFIAAVPEALIKQGLKAGDWVREVAKVTGGGGGGKPDKAQAGGKDPSKLDDALDRARSFAAEKLG